MSYQLTIIASTVATLNFETEENARLWMDSWEEQDYKNLDWQQHATEMELVNDKGKPLRVSYCEMNPNHTKD